VTVSLYPVSLLSKSSWIEINLRVMEGLPWHEAKCFIDTNLLASHAIPYDSYFCHIAKGTKDQRNYVTSCE
jgi:hypothetical protein